ncbi:MAG: hypothetical protein J3K34DRAFT_413383 [Monoraphidium minutum]|nr:MAG: hypothetical protein J3K34DRAFT_413383 [Monoraphidium minutum]
MAAAEAAAEAGWALKAGRMAAKQQAELEVLLQRAGSGRDELELRRLEEDARRTARLRVACQELCGLHRLEVAHLEHWLEGSRRGATPRCGTARSAAATRRSWRAS